MALGSTIHQLLFKRFEYPFLQSLVPIVHGSHLISFFYLPRLFRIRPSLGFPVVGTSLFKLFNLSLFSFLVNHLFLLGLFISSWSSCVATWFFVFLFLVSHSLLNFSFFLCNPSSPHITLKLFNISSPSFLSISFWRFPVVSTLCMLLY